VQDGQAKESRESAPDHRLREPFTLVANAQRVSPRSTTCGFIELENERSQLIERIGKLQSQQNHGCNHQVKAEMHEGLEPEYLSWMYAWRSFGRRRLASLPDQLAGMTRRLPPPRK
jgi:hypothetical protein